MGFLTKMRSTSPVLLVIIAVLFIVFMVWQDVGSSLGNRPENNLDKAVGEVNGEKIIMRDFEEKVKMMIDQQRAQNPNAEVDEDQIRNQVWDETVDAMILEQEAKKSGVNVSPDVLANFLFGANPPAELIKSFTDSTGNFDRKQYIEFMTKTESMLKRVFRAQKMPEDQMVDEIKKYKDQVDGTMEMYQKNITRQNLMTFSGNCLAPVSPSYAENKFRVENSTADISYVIFDASSVSADKVKVSPAEVQTYYDKYKRLFIQKPTRKIKYFTFPLEPSRDDSSNAQNRVNSLSSALASAVTPEERSAKFDESFAKFNGIVHDFATSNTVDPSHLPTLAIMQAKEVAGPLVSSSGQYFLRLDEKRSGANEIVKASHILFQFGGDASKDSLKTLCESVLARAKKGEDFGMLASQYSKDGSAQSGGDLGYFQRGKMVKPFEDAAFGNPVGSIVGPVESQFGYHIIKVTDKQSEEYKYSEISISTKMSSATKTQLLRDARKAKTSLEEGMNIDSLGKRFKKNVVETQAFEDQYPTLGSRALTLFAFANKENAVCDPMEMKYYGYVVAQVSELRNAGVVSLEDKQESIKAHLTMNKKLDVIKSKAIEAYGKVKGQTNLSALSQIDSNLYKVRVGSMLKENSQLPGSSQEPAVMAQVFIQPTGKVLEPIRGERGYFLVVVNNRSIADPSKAKDGVAQQIKSLMQSEKGNGYNVWFQGVKQKSTIVDNRNEFFGNFR